MRREINIPAFPQRIISLVPSQTELLYDLGLEDRVVGITKFCIHPEAWFRNKERVGGTKTSDFEKIHALKPDLIIGNKEENDKESIEELSKHFPVWMSEIYTFEDALKMISEVSEITQKESKGKEIVSEIRKSIPSISQNRNCLYFIWRKPWMVTGENVFINEMLQKAGFNNLLLESELFKNLKNEKSNTRYPELNDEMIKSLRPDYILLSSEPYPFKEKHIRELKEICPNSKILLVDGELFSWYGSRMKYAGKYFELLNKDEF